MECNVVKDLIPLYIDNCCSKESAKIVEEHLGYCNSCRELCEGMRTPCDVIPVSNAPIVMRKLNDWKASVMQSVLLFLSFAIITIGVALEAATPSGSMNGYWAVSLVVPATGFLLSLTNWYFVRLYKSRKSFSNCSLLVPLGITICAYIWAGFHYELSFIELFSDINFFDFVDMLPSIAFFHGIGIVLTIVFCVLSKLLSSKYAKMLGKE